jgi:hypothetical protein
MKTNIITTPKQLKQLAASIKEIAFMLEDAANLNCLQTAQVKIKKNKDKANLGTLEFSVRLDIFEEGELREVEQVLKEIKLF